MSNLENKKILLAITGSIAAYKTAELVRLLRTCSARVKVVMTKEACKFITPLSLQTLSDEPVHCDLLDESSEATMSHISLAKWADVLLVAPATANIMAKFAIGIADDLLTTLYLACPAPVVLVPSMNQHMWQHRATMRNKDVLIKEGVFFWGPNFGEQACGDIGPGRMIEPSEILNYLENFFAPKILSGIKVLITAGPTREKIDPIRYISNYSSGKMGYALAEAAHQLGAQTFLISGPTNLTSPFGVNRIEVETADEMHQEVTNNLSNCHIFISAAAVADYRCLHIANHKIKKPNLPIINLKQNIDILLSVSQQESPPLLVGFAAETEDLINNAKEKLIKKSLDIIIANLVGRKESGFNSDSNEVIVLTKDEVIDFPLRPKKILAQELMTLIFSIFKKKHEWIPAFAGMT